MNAKTAHKLDFYPALRQVACVWWLCQRNRRRSCRAAGARSLRSSPRSAELDIPASTNRLIATTQCARLLEHYRSGTIPEAAVEAMLSPDVEVITGQSRQG
ncbi:MAG: hypothetical protein U0892_22455 [Pirellulales bacterium]